MATVLTLGLPLASVLLGALITYLLNVRGRRRDEENDVYHGAISAVAVAIASLNYISHIKWGGSTPEEEAELAKKAGREFTERHLRAVADARAAVARASAYDPTLGEFYRTNTAAVYERGDELMARLRERIR
ncbi:hypothetical protein [Pengzhenrongella sp.]|jgi:hypothetical protein|uniref:hypothetical protein n=1 Tax=Pengzhenrongella sp. TaxID=2888820 RepID=UPI002F92BD7C